LQGSIWQTPVHELFNCNATCGKTQHMHSDCPDCCRCCRLLLLAGAQVDPVVFNMLSEDPGKVDYSSIGGLGEQIRELRESIELPLMNPELFVRVGIKPPKVRGSGCSRGCRPQGCEAAQGGRC
jgi:hypothetical protein